MVVKKTPPAEVSISNFYTASSDPQAITMAGASLPIKGQSIANNLLRPSDFEQPVHHSQQLVTALQAHLESINYYP
jgi:hypothetical protein